MKTVDLAILVYEHITDEHIKDDNCYIDIEDDKEVEYNRDNKNKDVIYCSRQFYPF